MLWSLTHFNLKCMSQERVGPDIEVLPAPAKLETDYLGLHCPVLWSVWGPGFTLHFLA